MAFAVAEALAAIGASALHLSMSHDGGSACAFVVAESIAESPAESPVEETA